MRLVLTPLFFLAIAAAAGVYAGPAAGTSEIRPLPAAAAHTSFAP
jgi:hypothetical protein